MIAQYDSDMHVVGCAIYIRKSLRAPWAMLQTRVWKEAVPCPVGSIASFLQEQAWVPSLRVMLVVLEGLVSLALVVLQV